MPNPPDRTPYRVLAYQRPLDGQHVTVQLSDGRRTRPRMFETATELTDAVCGQRGGHLAWFVHGTAIEALPSDQWQPLTPDT